MFWRERERERIWENAEEKRQNKGMFGYCLLLKTENTVVK